jgi:prolyl oligopeptidase
MLRKSVALLFSAVLAACASTPAPPATEVRPVTETLQGVTVTDPYRWLEDQNSPETRAWIDQQNARTDTVLAHLPNRDALSKRLEQLLGVDESSLPTWRNGRYFFTRRKVGEEKVSIYMRENGSDTVVVAAPANDPKQNDNVGIEDVSPDGKLLAFFVRGGGADEVVVHFYDVDAKHDLGQLPLARYSGITVAGDQAWYSRQTPEGPRVFRRALGGGDEVKLFGDGYTSDKIIGLGGSDDGRYLVAHVFHGAGGKRTDVFVKDVSDNAPFRPVVNDLEARTVADFAGDSLVLQTNWNAPNNRVFIAPIATPERANWRELVPENHDAAIQSIAAAGGRIFVRYLQNVQPRVVGYNLDGTSAGEVKFDVAGRLDNVDGTWHSPLAFYRFSSFALPPTIYQYEVSTGARTIFQQVSAPVNPDDFTVEQTFAISKDGTHVPLFLLYKKGLERNGKHPTYLTGYGGFNLSQLPGFSARAVTLAENGAVYALAAMRGGGEFGEDWHRGGMLDRKQNVFDDFEAASRFLIDRGYTSREHLGIGGTSNGGLLVMVAATQHPELYKAVMCGYPLIDMLRYDQFLVGRFWVSEYGSASDPNAFKWIYAYSPYQHVVKGTKYPAILFVTGDADTRVAPLHARKMTALMQASTGSDEPVLLRYHTAGGHSGGEPLSEQVKNESEIEGFLLWQLK